MAVREVVRVDVADPAARVAVVPQPPCGAPLWRTQCSVHVDVGVSVPVVEGEPEDTLCPIRPKELERTVTLTNWRLRVLRRGLPVVLQTLIASSESLSTLFVRPPLLNIPTSV